MKFLNNATENGIQELREAARPTLDRKVKKSFKMQKQSSVSGIFTAGFHRNVKIDDITLKMNEPTNLGNKDVVYIRFELPNGSTHEQRYFYYFSDTSQLGQVVEALLGPVEEGEEIDLAYLIGMQCNIVVEERQSKRGTTWLNVAEVQPID